ncbi:hypothetical protein F4859DRAFT_505128 [Xylaria cf. heliscus]|nr:hypothetical protein F4859DRAFT_505128 [Xylaria cf. heliscus]
MSNTTSTEPFKMRIPSPDPDLTGQALAREVPDDPNRAGSIYADQFLAHKCPSHFDEIQRRQFFCILDLRRLKYAADEIFAKKDWKLNILNFAKEYEKSRGLIMLRYGLYEFKSVKPSNEVLKKWRAAHGLPPEPEEANDTNSQKPRTPGPAGATKRKAEEELTPKANTLVASTANQNKRRNLDQEVDDPILSGSTLFKKSKRKADETDEVDENKPNKQQKSTPSTATTLFASIINKPRNGGASPSKPTSQGSSLFGMNNTNLPSGSVLSAHKIGSTPATNTGNIFSYLSESSPSSSGNENDDDDDDHETDDEQEQDSEDQGQSGAVSTDTSTPPIQNGSSLFGAGKTTSTPNIFGGLPKATDQSTKGGLFGRVQMGANGQPVRASPGPDEKQGSSVNQTLTTNETPPKRPGDYTFDPATTPISFGKPAPDAFNFSFGQPTSTPKAAPSSQGSGLFGGSTTMNGAPSFSFTQPSPSQNSLDQTNPHTDSPFPAPSSIGTTPVNGTPEPQSPHGDEEAPQEQIKLTDGGPGEEDETILHEVRAKAIKYIPVKGDEDEAKSPWSTRGVGPLRVLKNKSTGAVRILLRAEPRGHIAMNKTILSDVEYTPKDKTLKLVAASDDGSSLETWLLQVKKPEFALELAGVLEANKSANKK